MVEILATLLSAIGLGVALVRPRSTPVVAAAAGGVALVSAAATIDFVAAGRPGWAGATLVELIALLVPIVLLTRFAHGRALAGVACALAALASSALILRYVEDASLALSLAAMALWALPAAGAAAAGLYLRALDARRRRAVADVRRRQRLGLAHDLHDFVAHDVTAVVVQAQAARAVADRQPEEAVRALERIEHAGLRALGSIDRTLELLRDERDPGAPLDVGSIVELARTFGAEGRADVRLDVAPGVLERLSPEVSSTLHRVTAEALTNVRRHAPGAARVAIALDLEPGDAGLLAVLTVANEAPAGTGSAPLPDRRGGLGLAGLSERVEALGGTLSAGRAPDGAWQVRATLPVAP